MTITASASGMYTRMFYTALVIDRLGAGVWNAAKTALLGISAAAALYQSEELNEIFYDSVVELGHTAANTILAAAGIVFPNSLNRWLGG